MQNLNSIVHLGMINDDVNNEPFKETPKQVIVIEAALPASENPKAGDNIDTDDDADMEEFDKNNLPWDVAKVKKEVLSAYEANS
ncbi:MAG: hypothetical protein ACHQF4_07315 [Sphingobacteriales bacterium]